MFRNSIQDRMKFYYLLPNIPSDDISGCLYNFRTRECDQPKTVLELYDKEIHQKISMPNYQTLKTMVKRSVDQKLRLRSFDARNEKIETGHKGSSGVERGRGICYQWKEKGQCSKREQCSFRQESNDRAKPTPKIAPPSETPNPKTRGRSVPRKRNARDRSQSEKFNRPPCKYFLKGTCTKSLCQYLHPPECLVLQA